VKCLCGMLDAAPHFNYMSDVLQILVPKLNSDDGHTRALACASMQRLLRGGSHGDIMVEAVQLVADMVRACKCVCHTDAVRCLLVLELKDISRDDVQQGTLLFYSVLDQYFKECISGQVAVQRPCKPYVALSCMLASWRVAAPGWHSRSSGRPTCSY
jgi:hypothetical protein